MCILVHFDDLQFSQGHWWGDNIGIGVRAHTMYIYSLRHFLTTKGALIDGDGYPPLPPLKWPQKVTKICQKSLKIDIKNWSKNTILNGKIDFFTKIHSIDTKISKKWSKIDTYLGAQNVIKFDYQKGG